MRVVTLFVAQCVLPALVLAKGPTTRIEAPQGLSVHRVRFYCAADNRRIYQQSPHAYRQSSPSTRATSATPRITPKH